DTVALQACDGVLEGLDHGDAELVDAVEVESGDSAERPGGAFGHDGEGAVGRQTELRGATHLNWQIPHRGGRETGTLDRRAYEMVTSDAAAVVLASEAARPWSTAPAISDSHSRAS